MGTTLYLHVAKESAKPTPIWNIAKTVREDLLASGAIREISEKEVFPIKIYLDKPVSTETYHMNPAVDTLAFKSELGPVPSVLGLFSKNLVPHVALVFIRSLNIDFELFMRNRDLVRSILKLMSSLETLNVKGNVIVGQAVAVTCKLNYTMGKPEEGFVPFYTNRQGWCTSGALAIAQLKLCINK